MKSFLKIVGIIAVVALALTVALFFFFRSSATPSTSTQTIGTFEQGSEQQGTTNTQATSEGTAIPSNTARQSTAAQQIAKLVAGPIAGAALYQSGTPTTTIARYVMADNGHVFDIAVAVPGAVARPVSNTTIPGIVGAQWGPGGSAALVQYLDSGVIKTLSLTFAAAASSSAALPVHIQFLPDDIVSVAPSPDGKSVAYLLNANGGVDGYIAAANGTNGKKLFSLPLSQVLLSWPAGGTLLVQTKAATGVPGIAFSVSAKTGAVSQLVYAPGLSAIASPDFSRVIYQTTQVGDQNRSAYSHDTLSGGNIPLSFQPLPEKCAWSPLASTVLYCAVPLSYTPANYLDLWHAGTASAGDSIVAFNVATGQTSVVANPGVDIASLTISPDGGYALFITKGDRSLWSVRLTP